MSDVLLVDKLGEFERPPLVANLAQERFTSRELALALDVTPTRVADYSRFRVQLVAGPPAGREGRAYHSLDIYGLSIFEVFDAALGKAGRPALVLEMAHLLLGDLMGTREWRERRLIFAQDRERALKNPRTKAASDRKIAKMWDARRAELRADIFEAMPLWWSRDADRNFVIFVARNRELFQYIVDRNVNGGKIDPKPFEAAGMVFCLNATKTLAEIDKRLAAIVRARGGGAPRASRGLNDAHEHL